MVGRYLVVQKLGWGHFSTVWLARDIKFNTYVALKVQKSAKNYMEAAYDEVEILDVIAKNTEHEEWIKSLIYYNKDTPDLLKKGAISEHCHNVMLLNSFQHYGPNGLHFIMVFEILGVNLLEIMKRFDYKGIPIPLVRRIAKQVLMGLDYLHRICKIIHTDLKPENVIVSLTRQELEEIIKKGQLSTVNKNIKTFDINEANLLPNKQKTLLENVDTTGMTKQQKKKLKKKIKKNIQAQGGASDEDSDGEEASPAKKRGPLPMELRKLASDLNNEIERPRSYSLPNLALNQETEEYQFLYDRDFGAEIQ